MLQHKFEQAKLAGAADGSCARYGNAQLGHSSSGARKALGEGARPQLLEGQVLYYLAVLPMLVMKCVDFR